MILVLLLFARLSHWIEVNEIEKYAPPIKLVKIILNYYYNKNKKKIPQQWNIIKYYKNVYNYKNTNKL